MGSNPGNSISRSNFLNAIPLKIRPDGKTSGENLWPPDYALHQIQAILYIITVSNASPPRYQRTRIPLRIQDARS